MAFQFLSGLMSKLGAGGAKAASGAAASGASSSGASGGIGAMLKNFKSGAKNPMQAQGASGKFGSFLRYFLDEDARKAASKQQMGGDEIEDTVGGLPLSTISKKVGDYTVKYGNDKNASLADLLSTENEEEKQEDGGNKIVGFFKRMLSERSDKVKVVDAQGNMSMLPRKQLELAQKQGYKLVS